MKVLSVNTSPYSQTSATAAPRFSAAPPIAAAKSAATKAGGKSGIILTILKLIPHAVGAILNSAGNFYPNHGNDARLGSLLSSIGGCVLKINDVNDWRTAGHAVLHLINVVPDIVGQYLKKAPSTVVEAAEAAVK